MHPLCYHEKNFGFFQGYKYFLSHRRFCLKHPHGAIKIKIKRYTMCEDNVQPSDENTQKTEILLHTLVGEYLALGYTNEMILEHLQVEQHLSIEEAQKILRGVYDSWTSVREALNLQAEDDRNWHQHLRMKLLQVALQDSSIPAQRLALQILDSLASVQGISTTTALTQPLMIELVEKKVEPEPEPKGSSNS